jgi:flagellar biosynthesis protein FlhF
VQDAAAVAQSFAALEPTALAVTKLDETAAPSGLLHGPAASGLPVSVLCAGQRVPEHVAPATAGAILDYLVPRAGAAPGASA